MERSRAVKTLLIVEDDNNQRFLYEKELTEDGYRVLLAGNGKEAVNIVEEENLDLVVLDIRMPGMDGIEALGKMLDRKNKLPVIIHTAYPNYKDNFMSWAAEAYIVKSSDLSELKVKIHEILGDD
jgi:DNA-binding response OmpR family regulator